MTEAAMVSIGRAPEQVARFIMKTTDTSRADRLWPADPLVFATNPLSVAYGACGIAYFLDRSLGGVPDDVVAWMRARELNNEEYPPGLYVGLAGIAVAWQALGYPEEARAAFRLACQSPLRFADPAMLYGAAGLGWAGLALYDATADAEYLDMALEAGRFLLTAADREGRTLRWRSRDSVHVGYGHGSAGIAHFLLQLGKVAACTDFIEASRAAFQHVLETRLSPPSGIGWADTYDMATISPHFVRGSAGIGAVAVRFAAHFGEAEYQTLSEEIAAAIRVRLALVPGLFEGLSGIGEFFIDLHRLTGSPTYREAANEIAESILWFGIENLDGLAFPGISLDRLTNDYATGAAGIGLFLLRCCKLGPRPFLDHTFISDRISPILGPAYSTTATMRSAGAARSTAAPL